MKTITKTALRTDTSGNRMSKTHTCQHLLSLIMALALTAGMLVGLPARAVADTVETDEFTSDGSFVDGGSAIEADLDNSGIPVLTVQAVDEECDQDDEPEHIFQMAITTPEVDTTFWIPVTSMLNGRSDGKTYDWNINWGDDSTETASGSSSDSGGIPHVYADAGDYIISITPNDSAEAWLAAFGFGTFGNPNRLTNKYMVTGILSPLRPEMTRTYDQISATMSLPSYEWSRTFSNLANLTLAPTFEGWEDVTAVGDWFAETMFAGCASLTTLPADFNLPQNITTTGRSFASGMFIRCSRLTTLPADFTFPQGITAEVVFFAQNMFAYCTNLTSLPEGFNLPQNITAVGYTFAGGMFANCYNLTSLPAGFNLPQGITTAGEGFAQSMFYYCTSLTTLPEGFNLPQNITTEEGYFAANMFKNCTHVTTLPEGFNLPQNITTAGEGFAANMFQNCTGLTTLPAGFNLPQDITAAGSFFADYMFSGAGSATFQINDEFCFPAGIPANAENAFEQTFQLSASAPVQNRTAASIIGSCPTPNSERDTFNEKFLDLDYIPVNWGGLGLTGPPVGTPGSGDYDGDGIVTMNDAMATARAAIGAISPTPAQTAAIDMDGDGVITMTDALRVMRKAIGL